jgi:polyhydroxybutyrate depolymerase
MHAAIRFSLLALACAVLSRELAAQQLLGRTVDVHGVDRDYMVYLPVGYDGQTELPMMLVYHGGSMDPLSMLQYVDMRPLADQEGFIPVYPAGLPDRAGDRVWDTAAGPFANGVDEIGFTSALIDAMDLEFAVDLDRVYACGYSNGANLAWELAALLSDRICAVGPVAGSMWTWIEPIAVPTRPVPVISIHGTLDFYNPWGGNQYSMGLIAASEFWVAQNQATSVPTVVDLPDINKNDLSTVQRYRWADGDQSVHVEHYKVIRGGHDWPGVGGGLKGGNQDINATELIWEFCSQYSLSGRIDPLMELTVRGPVIAGTDTDLFLEFAAPSSPAFLALSLSLGTTLVPQLGVALNLTSASPLVAPKQTSPSGTASWTVAVPPGAAGATAFVQGCQFGATSNVAVVLVQ